jgi:hypothetical protein
MINQPSPLSSSVSVGVDPDLAPPPLLVTRTPLTTAQAAEVTRCLLAIKQKQIGLEDSLLTQLRRALHVKLNEEEDQLMELFGFPTDDPALEVCHSPPPLTAFLLTYFSQQTNA